MQAGLTLVQDMQQHPLLGGCYGDGADHPRGHRERTFKKPQCASVAPPELRLEEGNMWDGVPCTGHMCRLNILQAVL